MQQAVTARQAARQPDEREKMYELMLVDLRFINDVTFSASDSRQGKGCVDFRYQAVR